MKSPKTWVLIADGGHARVLETIGHDHPLSQVPHLAIAKQLPPSHELGTDQPPRTHDSMGSARHAIEPHTDPHRELKRSFAEEVVHHLQEQLAAGSFAKLVVVAPPVTLGDLRMAMSKNLADHVVAEVAKDLVKVPNNEIRSHLKDVVSI
jgi:protein required for attachment to host cells